MLESKFTKGDWVVRNEETTHIYQSTIETQEGVRIAELKSFGNDKQFNDSTFDERLFNEKLKSLEDWEFNLRCALNNYIFHHVGYADDSKVLIRLHEESMMRNQELMIANQLLFNEICNKNRLYVECFGKIESEKNSSFKDYLNLFIPPVFFIIKNKIFNAFKNKISSILSSAVSSHSRK